MPSEFPFLSGGNTPLTAEMLNRVIEYVRRQGRVYAVPPLRADFREDGWHVSIDGSAGLWAILGPARAPGRHAWREAWQDSSGLLAPRPAGRAGGGELGEATEAAEANGRSVPEGTVAWLEMSPSGVLGFCAPAYDPAGRLDAFWAFLDGEEDGGYGWIEALPGEDMDFREKDGGRMASAGSDDAAVEASGQSGIPDGTLVLMLRPPGGRPAFRRAEGALGVWGKITGKAHNPVWRVSLGGATEGTWTLLASRGGTTATAGPVEATAGAEDIRAALDLALGEGQARVSASEGGGGWDIELLDAWGGGSGAVVAVDGSGLEGGEGAEAELAQEGRDDPHTDGQGAYGWIEMGFSADGTLAPLDGGRGSDWPLGAAVEMAGETKVPPGTLVRLRPLGAVPRESADGTVVEDQRWGFLWGGTGQWASLGVGAAWEVDLGSPSAGVWSLGWAEAEESPLAEEASHAVTLTASAGASFTLSWAIDWPRLEPDGSGGFALVRTPPSWAVPAACTAGALQALLEANPVLAGSVTATGGPLGTAPVVLSFGGPLAGMALPAFGVSGVSGGSAFATATSAGAGPRTTLLPFDATADAVRSALLALGQDGRRAFSALRVLRPAAAGPLSVLACGYPSAGGLPSLSLRRWLAYGADGLGEGEASVSAAVASHPGAAAAHQGGGLYAAVLLESVAPSPSGAGVPLLWDGRLVAVLATEAGGRRDLPAGEEVRAVPASRGELADPELGDGPVAGRWAFQAPAAGFWAAVLSGGRTAAEYAVVPASAPATRRPGTLLAHATATERSGCRWVPANAIVWVEPGEPGEDGRPAWGFRYAPYEEVRLLRYLGAGWSADEPSADAQLQPDGSPCLVEDGSWASSGCWHVGVLAGYAGGEAGLLPRYRIDGPSAPDAADGEPGLVSPLPQVLGAGGKASRTGWLRFNGDGLPGDDAPTGGEEMPDTSYWFCELSRDEQRFGASASASAGGGWFGLVSSGTLPPEPVVYDANSSDTALLAAAVGTADTVLPVSSVFGAVSVGGYLARGPEAMLLEEVSSTPFSGPPVPGASRYWRVARAQLGTAAASHLSGAGLRALTAYPQGGVGPAAVSGTYFRTTAAAFALNGVLGGSGTVDLPCPRRGGQALTFSGGLLTSVATHPDPSPAPADGVFYDTTLSSNKRFSVVAGLVKLRDL